MAIMKGSFRVTRRDGELSPENRESFSDEEDGEDMLRGESSSSGTDETCSEADSGMGSDVCDLSELGEPGTEFCQVGNQTCCVPLELYDLPDLLSVLSLETWNELLTEEERVGLAQYLPDMDHETFVSTITELLSGVNFHFGSPLENLFARLKGGLCEPRVVLCCRASTLMQKRRHYHYLRRYQNSMVGNLFRIRNAWQSYKGYSIEQKLEVVKRIKSQKVSHTHNGGMGSDTASESEASGEQLQHKRFKTERMHPTRPSSNVLTHRSKAGYKDNPKGLLKVAAPKSSMKKGYVEATSRYSSPTKHGVDTRLKKSGPRIAGLGRDHVSGYDDETDTYALEHGHQMNPKAEWNGAYGGSSPKSSLLKPGKNRRPDQGVTIAAYGLSPKNDGHSEKEWHAVPKDLGQRAHLNQADGHPTNRRSKVHGESIFLNQKPNFDDWDLSAKKLKAGGKFATGKSKAGFDLRIKSNKMSPVESFYGGNYSARTSGETKIKYSQNRGASRECSRNSMYDHEEETESDSADEVEEVGDTSPTMSGDPVSAKEGFLPEGMKSTHDYRKSSKLAKKGMKSHDRFFVGSSNINVNDLEKYSMKSKNKSKKTNESSYLLNHGDLKKAQMTDKSKLPSSFDKKQKAIAELDNSSYLPDFSSDQKDEFRGTSGSTRFLNEQMQTEEFGSRVQIIDAYDNERGCDHIATVPLLPCSSKTKKRKGKQEDVYPDEPNKFAYQQASPTKQIDDARLAKKKGRKSNDVAVSSSDVVNPLEIMLDKVTPDAEPETKIRKKPFTPITPTVHTGFSFSIVHLLTAVRKALITMNVEDANENGSHPVKNGGNVNMNGEVQSRTLQIVNITDPSKSQNAELHAEEHVRQKNLPYLTVQEIVNKVRSNPGDPCILETQEPLQDLVRGVLKIFSSRNAPLGAKGWKPLVSYEKSNKSWFWVGPLSSTPTDNDVVEEETSSEAWGIPHKMLVKLVDAFANWLKNGQETLQQIGSLPPPPTMVPVLDESQRFRDLRALKSLNTISPSSDEVRAYFRKEEFLRYSIPDRAFSYTALDGKKSIVAPLRRGGGKPTSKARDHFMLKPDRPPHVTILCLVRDAAARLPGRIGTRADVCTLIRDSQYIVEDVTDAQVNQVVSGALDRLHYERDPCVQFDGEKKLWVYLHRDREEEDFEDDGTSSTKKWKRQKKDANDNSDSAAANEVNPTAAGDLAGGSSFGYDFNTDLNVGAVGERAELVYSDIRPNVDNVQTFVDSAPGAQSQNNSISWGALETNPK